MQLTPESWQEIKRVLAEALERAPAERGAYLDQACKDPLLRREVEELIAARDEGLDSFMEQPAVESRGIKSGTKLGGYEILALLGAGGMGEVYHAHDSKLRRDVAIKVLPAAGVPDSEQLARFHREAWTLASLNHPNIATIYGLEESEGVHYLVMELVPGQTLAERLSDGPCSVKEALGICSQIAEALEAAHERGVIHRDLKPANVKWTPENRVKVLDFGLAKAFVGDGGPVTTLSTKGTQDGRILGTPAYMSPEQARGRPVDRRADVWAFGCVLYELLTGRRAFRGETLADTIAAVLEREPDLEILPSATPAKVRDLLRRCLQKDPLNRLRDLGDARIEIEEAEAALVAIAARVRCAADSEGLMASAKVPSEEGTLPGASVVVLPFVNLSTDSEADYFSDGLTDEIITDLSSVRALRVISRTSAIRAKAMPEDIQKLTRELQVRYVLEGAVRKSGNNLRVTAKLVDALTDSVLWADKYGGTLEDVFSIQETLSRKIVGALKVKLSPDEDQGLAQRRIADVQAYDCYLKAKQEILSYSREGLERALDYLQRAIGIVGDNILLISALGQVYWQFVNAGITKDPTYLERARECADRILALDNESPHGHRLLGMLQLSQGNYQEGLRGLKRALAKQPNDADTLGWLIAIYAYSGKPHVATSLAKKLLEIDPLTPIYRCLPGLLALMGGEFGRALGPFAESVAMDPTNPALRFCYAHVLALNGRLDESVQAFEALARDMPDNFFARLGLFYKHALQGEKEPALHASTEDLKTAASADPQYCWNMAQCYALVNERSEALDWLERALSAGFINYPLLARQDPFLGNVRGEPRFEQLMNIAKKRWEAFEV